jgi:hypothetical protein
MAASFGVSQPFLDSELSRFIAAGRLDAKMDKVSSFHFFFTRTIALKHTRDFVPYSHRF